MLAQSRLHARTALGRYGTFILHQIELAGGSCCTVGTDNIAITDKLVATTAAVLVGSYGESLQQVILHLCRSLHQAGKQLSRMRHENWTTSYILAIRCEMLSSTLPPMAQYVIRTAHMHVEKCIETSSGH